MQRNVIHSTLFYVPLSPMKKGKRIMEQERIKMLSIVSLHKNKQLIHVIAFLFSVHHHEER